MKEKQRILPNVRLRMEKEPKHIFWKAAYRTLIMGLEKTTMNWSKNYISKAMHNYNNVPLTS